MPKAPRDQESTTPKKRNRKAAPKTNGNGNGVHAENGNGALAQSPELAGDTQVISEMKVMSEVSAAPLMEPTPSLEERIRVRAYELYVQRGDNGGSPEHDWLRAKAELSGQ